MFKNLLNSESSGGVREPNANTMMMCEDDTGRAITQQEIFSDESKTVAPMVLTNDNNSSRGFPKHDYTINNVLERETFLNTYTWDGTEGLIAQFNLLNALLDNENIASKRKYFRYIHTDMAVTVKINPQPFHQGLLMVVAVPTNFFNRSNGPILTTRGASWFPHVMINASVMNTAELHLPFLSNFETYYNDSSRSDHGYIIQIYSVVGLTGNIAPISLEAEVYGRFVNPSLQVPTAEPVTRNRIVAQAGDSDLQETNETGIVTKITDAVASTMEATSSTLKSIPLVGSYMPMLTWLARTAHKTSSYFGWSKPINLSAVHIVQPSVGYRMCNSEGQDNSVSLSLSPDNAVDALDNAFNKIDEMDYSYLLERKSLLSEVQYPFSVGTNSFAIMETRDLSINPRKVIMESNALRRWTVKYEIHLVKTKFHTGRLLLMLDTSRQINTADQARDVMNEQYCKVVDISTTDRIYFTLPWTGSRPFDSVQSSRLIVSAFTKIAAPDTVAQTITLVPYVSYTEVEVGNSSSLVAQSGAEMDCCSNNVPIPYDDLIPRSVGNFTPNCIGESQTNLRQLAKRFTRHGGGYYTSPTLQLANFADLRIDGDVASLFETINRMYMYRTGGLRIKLVFSINSNVKVTLRPDLGGATSTPAYAEQWFSGHLNNVAEITVPYYHAYRRADEVFPWTPVTFTFYNDLLEPIPAGNIHLYLAAGDDYSAFFPLADFNAITPGGGNQ